MDLNLEAEGIRPKREVYWNLPESVLYEEAIRRSEGQLSQSGALVVLTGEHTGRSPRDRFIVRESSTESKVDWGPVNLEMSPQHFEQLEHDIARYLSDQELFVQDLQVCSHPDYACSVRVVTEYAWHSIFARNLFITQNQSAPLTQDCESFRVIYAPRFKAKPEVHCTNSGTAIVLNLERRLVLIAGTEYAGEMKKSIFTSLNYLLPERDVFPMHCSANMGADGDVALFFGLSGTGKTTLSADPYRKLIGDDEHGWHADGVFNFEGGCYAKAIGLNHDSEPEIFRASNQFGTILENVVLDPEQRTCDFGADSITENTRAAYPLTHLELVVNDRRGGVPSTLFLLTYDAFGVLPPIAKLTREQAIYYFLLGYTAKVAGTEAGVKEPQTTFSSCFGAPFLPRPPREYGEMLDQRLAESGANVWLLNTGISGGPYGVGSRIPLKQTRALVQSAISGELERGPFATEEIFSLNVPAECPGVDSAILNPRACWSDAAEYDRVASALKVQFDEQMKKFDGP